MKDLGRKMGEHMDGRAQIVRLREIRGSRAAVMHVGTTLTRLLRHRPIAWPGIKPRLCRVGPMGAPSSGLWRPQPKDGGAKARQ